MMIRTVVVTALKNLGWLVVVALPLFFLLTWVQALVAGAEGSRDLGYVLETGAVYYLTNLPPVLVGGVIHQVIWLVLPRAWPRTRRMIMALVVAPLIPITVWLSWGGPARSLVAFAGPMVLALAVYVLLMRAPAVSEPVAA